MRVLVTGSKGFIGLNLVINLKERGFEVLEFDKESSLDDLNEMTKHCDFVVHLAGVNRPTNNQAFYEGNSDLTATVCEALIRNNNCVPILLSSSVQASLDNDYGASKQLAEKYITAYSQKTGVQTYIYRFSNLFGKWSRPNYNSVIATWCSAIANGQPITINDPNVELTFEYIDDVVEEIIGVINGEDLQRDEKIRTLSVGYTISLKEVADLLTSFSRSRETLQLPLLKNKSFEKKLFSTYLSYLPAEELAYSLSSHIDYRGSFTEFLKMDGYGQVSLNISKPGITKGQHWHNTKIEKFLVIAGSGIIQLRHIITNEFTEFLVSESDLKVIDIAPGYTHNIINTSDTNLVTLIWVNEEFDSNRPDTFSLEV